MARKRIERKSNPNLVHTIKELKRLSRENAAPIWKDVAERLERPLSQWAEVNVGEIEALAEKDETIVVPGKLLGSGNVDKKVTVAAFKFTLSARKKISDAGGKELSILELVEKNPRGTGVRIME